MTNDIKDTGVISQQAINESLGDMTNSAYSQTNRIPLIKGEYRKEMFIKLKDLFLNELYKAAQEEEEACKKLGIIPQMQGDNLKAVEDLVDHFDNWFQLEALWEFLFRDNEIPTLEQINIRAEKLNNNLGELEL